MPLRGTRATEAVAGLTTFFTTAYIVVVNPTILATAGTGMPFTGVLTATVALCFVMTLLMGLYADLPFAVAPGMGINAFVTYTLILRRRTVAGGARYRVLGGCSVPRPPDRRPRARMR